MALDLTHPVGFVPGPCDGVPPDAGVALGVAWLQQRNPQVVLVPLMRHYEDNDLLRRAVPKSRVMTRRSRHGPSITPTAAVLACWPLEEDLGKLHRHASQGGAVAIIRWDNGWAERAWIDSLAAVNLATGMSGSGLPIPGLDPVVAEGMKSLQAINHSTWHSTDRDRVKWTLLHLPRHGHRYAPDDLTVWAACNGFQMHEVVELHHLAQRVCSGHTFQISRRPYRADIIDVWRRAAADAPYVPNEGSGQQPRSRNKDAR